MAARMYATFNNKLVALPHGTENVYVVASGTYSYRLPNGSYLTQKQLEQLAASQSNSKSKV